MKHDVVVKKGIVIPGHEIEVTTSRSGGAGGQHVNKTDSRITLRWNVPTTTALDAAQKERVLSKLQGRLTTEGDLIVHNSTTRSQKQNLEMAMKSLAYEVKKALHVPKKRVATKVSKSAKEARLQSKARHSTTKKLRSKTHRDE